MHWLRRGVFVALVAGAVAVGAAAPAGADPPEPTDYRSTVEGLSPATDAVELSVVGGDAFLRIEVEPGHEVIVEGYKRDPYLRILPDGTVQQNQRSEATYLNEDRYARVEIPDGRDAAAEPQWETIDDDGEHAWHDHRIHWMSPDRRPGIREGDVVQEWSVPLVVDGTPIEVRGRLVLVSGVSPVPWALTGLVVAVAVAAAGWRRWSLPIAVVAVCAGGVLAVVAGLGERSAIPAGTGGSSLTVVVPLVGLSAGLLAVALVALGRRAPAGIAVLGSAAALAGWALLRLDVLRKPVLPTELSAGFDRAATVVALATAVAGVVLVFHSGAISPAPLEELSEADAPSDG